MGSNVPQVKPFPADVPQKEYLYLSEFEKMVQGYPYRPHHECLIPPRLKCRQLIQKYNQTAFEDGTTRRAILDDLFDPSCKANKSMFIEPSFRCDYGINIKVGNNFYANFDCVLLDSGPIEFGSDCMLAPGVHVYSATHPLNSAHRLLTDMPNYYELTAPVKVGNNCWLGGGCIINPGVTLGNNVIVGAGAVVTKSYPDNVVIAGNPAKIIRQMPEPSVGEEPFWKNMDGVMSSLL